MTLDMTWLAWGVVILAALIVGVLVQLYLQPKTSYEWLVTGVGAVLGAWLGSEITAFATIGPVWENLAIVPAVIGGVIGAAVFEFGARAIEPAPTPA